MFERILIPVDGSRPSRNAASHAIDLAAEQGATIHALYVIEPVAVTEGGTGQVHEAMRESGESIVAELKEQAEAKDVTAITDVETGVAHREILEYAEGNDIDLIVMGTHGRTGLGRYLLGSVTEKIVRISDIPVLTVRPGDEEEE